MTTITIDLPDDVARQAGAAGLLGSEQVLSIFKESLRSAARNMLFARLDASVQPTPALPQTEQDKLVQEAKMSARTAKRPTA